MSSGALYVMLFDGFSDMETIVQYEPLRCWEIPRTLPVKTAYKQECLLAREFLWSNWNSVAEVIEAFGRIWSSRFSPGKVYNDETSYVY